MNSHEPIENIPIKNIPIENIPIENIIDNSPALQKALQELSWAIQNSSNEFSLYFAHCNYKCLRELLIQRLEKLHSDKVRSFCLDESTTTLYASIQTELKGEIPQVLMVLGLESVRDPRQVFESANRVREEFRKHFPFLLILWITDRVLEQISQWAPDFKNLATTTKFIATPDVLLWGIERETDDLFARTLNPHTPQFTGNVEARRWEAHTVLRELDSQGRPLEPAHQASMDFVLGREADDEAKRSFEARQEISANRHMETACQCYQASLAYWQSVNNLERQSVLLLHLGRNHAYHAKYYESKCEPEASTTRQSLHSHWEQARQYLQQCLKVFEQIHRIDLTSEYINELGEVLQKEEDWESLQGLVKQALTLHQNYEYSSKLAQDYCFLADIALHQSRWQDANHHALQALDIITSKTPDQWLQHQTALLLLAKAQQHLERNNEAIASLEQARKIGEQARKTGSAKPQVELRVLETLRSLYFQQKRYLEAFQVKHEQYSVEQQYGLRAFRGPGRLKSQRYACLTPEARQPATIAQEILESGRKRDIDELIKRIKEPQYKLTILYGQSGVGKSSVIEAGLVPALKDETVLGSFVIPILLRNYAHWVEELGKFLAESLKERMLLPAFELNSIEPILEQLKRNEQQHLFTVLIFDQFEELFFVEQDSNEQQQFTDFFSRCLTISGVKIILSLREDQLHLLLRYSRSIKGNNTKAYLLENILNRENLYYISNFSPADAQSLIQALTKRSQVYQPDLIEALVRDLADEQGEIRPIELQIVGSQLEEEHIVNLAQYQKSGPKEKFVQRYLDGVIADCGEENRFVAELALYLLTDENSNRPLKTKLQLETDLRAISQELTQSTNSLEPDLNLISQEIVQDSHQLELVLKILVESGLVVLLQEIPDNRYQLVHDYLATIIRNDKETRLPQLKLALKNEITKRKQAEAGQKHALENLKKQNYELEKLNSLLQKQKTRLEKAKYRLIISVIGLVILSGLAGFSAVWAKKNGIKVTAERSNALLASDNGLDALVTGLSAFSSNKVLAPFESIFRWFRVKQSQQLEDSQGFREALQEAAYSTAEINRLEDHQSTVRSVSFSPDGKLLVSAGDDNTAILWNSDGTKITALSGHQGPIYSARFSPDGKFIATASEDHTVRLWCQDCQWECPYILKEHQGAVRSVSFSPDNQYIATAGDDQTVILWKRDGSYIRYLNTIRGHQGSVYSVSFSPDSQQLVTASADQTVKLWTLTGTLVSTMTGHAGKINSAIFSPDGQTIATASDDATVRLWNLDGTLRRTLMGHESAVYSVSFSPDSQTIATASADKTIKLWSAIDGQELQTLIGHQDSIYQVSFSSNETLATASADTTVRLWQLNPYLILGHGEQISAISFSADNQQIVTVSTHHTVKHWHRDNQSIRYISIPLEQQGPFEQVSFSPDRQLIATVSANHTIQLRDFDGTIVKTLVGHQGAVSNIVFSPDGKRIATVSEDDHTVKFWDLSDASPKTLPHQQPIRSLSFSTDATDPMITIVSQDNTVTRWSWHQIWKQDNQVAHETIVTGQTLQQLIGQEIGIIRASPDGHTLATVAREGDRVQLWDIRNDPIIGLVAPQSAATPITTPVKEIKAIKEIKFSPDGRILAMITRGDNSVQLWNIQNGIVTEQANLQPEEIAKEVKEIKFSPDGSLIATVSKDKIIRVWNLNGEEQARFNWHYDDNVETLEFSLDNRFIALSSSTGRIILWNWHQGNRELEQFSCDRVQNYLKHAPSVEASNRTLCNRLFP